MDKDYDTLVYRKAKALLELRKVGRDTALKKLVRDARTAGQSEIARDGDLRLALHSRNERALAQVYFGTPFPAYRRTMDRLAAQAGMKIPEEYVEKGDGKTTGTWSLVEDRRFKSSQLPERMAGLLLSERYRQFTTTHLACEVLHDRHFHHQTSAQQIYQLVRRVRRLLKTVHPEFELSCEQDRYSIQIPPGLAILHRRRGEGHSSFVERLRVIFGEREFSSREAQAALEISQSQYSSRLQVELEARTVLAVGQGKRTRYRMS